MAKEGPKSVRFTREVLDAIKEAAAAENRNANNYIETVVIADLKAKGYLPRP